MGVRDSRCCISCLFCSFFEVKLCRFTVPCIPAPTPRPSISVSDCTRIDAHVFMRQPFFSHTFFYFALPKNLKAQLKKKKKKKMWKNCGPKKKKKKKKKK